MNSTPAPDPHSTFILAMQVASSRIEELEAENRSLRSVITSLEERLQRAYAGDLVPPTALQLATYGLVFTTTVILYLALLAVIGYISYDLLFAHHST